MQNAQFQRTTRFRDLYLEIVNEKEPRRSPDDNRPKGPRVEPIVPQFSTVVKNFLSTISKSRGVSIEMVVPACLAAISAAAGSKVTVDFAGYTNRCNIWTCVIAPSGSNKSQPAADAFAPLVGVNRTLYDMYVEEVEKAKATNKKVDEDSIIRRVKRQQILINDATPEARNQALLDNPHGLLLYADELSTFLGNMDRYSSGNESAQLMSIYDGKDIQINRKGDYMQVIESPYLSVFGTIQPQIYADMMLTDKMLTSGFTQRMLAFYPEPVKDRTFNPDTTPDPQALKAWEELLTSLYCNSRDIKLTLTPKAQHVYSCFFNLTERLIHDEDTSPAVASAISKMRIMIIKLAALLKLGYYTVPSIFSDHLIDKGCMLGALQMCLLLLDTFEAMDRAAADEMPLLPKRELARQICLQCPALANKEFLIEKFNASRATAYRWLAEFGINAEDTKVDKPQALPQAKPVQRAEPAPTPAQPANAPIEPRAARDSAHGWEKVPGKPGVTKKGNLISFSLTDALKEVRS